MVQLLQPFAGDYLAIDSQYHKYRFLYIIASLFSDD